MIPLTEQSLFSLLEKFNEKFILDFSDVRNPRPIYFPIGRCRYPTDDLNYPLFVIYRKKSTKKSVSISMELYTANAFPTDTREILLKMDIEDDEFSYEKYASRIKIWALNPLVWEEDLSQFIEKAKNKYN